MAEKQEEKKLGPNVTYTNPDKGSKLVTVAGVLLKEGQAVNLEERLGKAKAEPILKKLAKNKYFKVDGGEDHAKKDEEAEVAPDATQANWAISEEARIRKTEGDEAADKFVESLDESGTPQAQKAEQEQSAKAKKAEQDYKAPDKPTLESQQNRPSTRER